MSLLFSTVSAFSQADSDYDDPNLDYGSDTLEGHNDPLIISQFIYDHCPAPHISNLNILHFETFATMAITFSSIQEQTVIVTNNNTTVVSEYTIANQGYIPLDLESSYTITGYNECGFPVTLKTFETTPLEPTAFEASKNLIVQLGRWGAKGETQTTPLDIFLTQTRGVYIGEILSFIQHKVRRGASYPDDFNPYVEDILSTPKWWNDTAMLTLDKNGKDLLLHAFGETEDESTQACNCTVVFRGNQDVTPKFSIKDYGDGTSDLIPLVQHDFERTRWRDEKAQHWKDLTTVGPASFEQWQSTTIRHKNRIPNAIGHEEKKYVSSIKTAEVRYLMVCSKDANSGTKLPENCACDREIAVEAYAQARMIATAEKGDQHKRKSTKIAADTKITANYNEYRGSNELNADVIPILTATGRVSSECEFTVNPDFWDNYLDILYTGVKIYVAAKTGSAGVDSVPFRIRIDSTVVDTTLVGTAISIANQIMQTINKYPALGDSLFQQIKRAAKTRYWSKQNCKTEDEVVPLFETRAYKTTLKPNEELILNISTAASHYLSGEKSWYTHTAIVQDYALATVLIGHNDNDPDINCCNPYIAVGSAKGANDDGTSKTKGARGLNNYGLGRDKFQYSSGSGTVKVDKDMWRFVEKRGIQCGSTGGLAEKRTDEENRLTHKMIVSSTEGNLLITNQSDETVDYTVVDLYGKIVATKAAIKKGATLQKSGLSSGTYIIQFTTPTTQFVQRAIIY